MKTTHSRLQKHSKPYARTKKNRTFAYATRSHPTTCTVHDYIMPFNAFRCSYGSVRPSSPAMLVELLSSQIDRLAMATDSIREAAIPQAAPTEFRTQLWNTLLRARAYVARAGSEEVATSHVVVCYGGFVFSGVGHCNSRHLMVPHRVLAAYLVEQ